MLNTSGVTQADVDVFNWFHSINFGNGVVSKGRKVPAILQAEIDIALKHGVEGKSVLDIGAWDGAFSFAAVDRGAREVTAVDGWIWADRGWSSKKPFDLANQAFGNKVKSRIADVYDMTPGNSGTHDVVLFLAVLYHLKHPLLALERIADLTQEYAVIETETVLDTVEEPTMRFYPGTELAGDPTNWCAPNIACCKAWLHTVGFKRVEVSRHPVHVGRPVNDAGGRYVFHAWK